MKKLMQVITFINFKTLYFNFKFLPFKEAFRLPFFISRQTVFSRLNGTVIINSPLKTGLVRIGFGNVGIFDKKRLRTVLEIDGLLEFNGSCNIGHGSKISVGKSGKITFGNDFKVSAESTIISHHNVKFGNGCLLSWDVLVMDTDFHKIYNQQNEVINQDCEVIISDNVWIGCRALILKGSAIPSGSIIGAGSVVSSRCKFDNALYAGVPALKLKDNIKWNS